MFENKFVWRSFAFTCGGLLGILLGKFLEKDKEMTEKYLTDHNIPH